MENLKSFGFRTFKREYWVRERTWEWWEYLSVGCECGPCELSAVWQPGKTRVRTVSARLCHGSHLSRGPAGKHQPSFVVISISRTEGDLWTFWQWMEIQNWWEWTPAGRKKEKVEIGVDFCIMTLWQPPGNKWSIIKMSFDRQQTTWISHSASQLLLRRNMRE